MKLSHFLGVVLIILILVQSSSPFEWQPFTCKSEDKLKGLVFRYLIHHDGMLYFYYPEFVVRNTKAEIQVIPAPWDKPFHDFKFLFYGEPEYVNYKDMEYPPDFLNLQFIGFYDALLKEQWYTAALKKIDVNNNKSVAIEFLYEEGKYAG